MLTLDKPPSRRQAKKLANQQLNEQNEEPNSLWNNPAVNEMRLKMTKEQIEDYKRKGEAMYGDMDFDNLEKKIYTAAIYIEEYLKAGMHPSALNNDDRAVLESKHGKKWYTKFGYSETDITPSTTNK